VEVSRCGLVARSFAFVFVLGGSATVFAGSEKDAGARQTARYFTINQVLAQLDRRSEQAPSHVQLAALDAGSNQAGMQTDARAADAEPFGFTTFRAPEGMLWEKWRKLETELAGERQVLVRCQADGKTCLNPAAQKYLTLISDSRQLPGRSKIAQINRAINAAIRYTSDEEQYGVADLWTAPLASLASGRGDCEDYAIAKYAALRDAGFAFEDLRLLIVRDRNARQDHAVVGVRHEGRWLMLDNRHDILLEEKDAQHFTPLFALDQQGVKLFAMPYDKPQPSPPATVLSGHANVPAPASIGNEPTSAGSLGLRLDTFEPPELRGRL
jgi:predicted transglutaminase-like cysteine proteinase